MTLSVKALAVNALVVGTLACPAAAREISAYEQCLGKHIAPAVPGRQLDTCWFFFVRHDNVVMHREPEGNSESIRELPWGLVVEVDWRSTKAGPRGWMRVNYGIDGWVETRDLAGKSDFRRVVGCWPVEAINRAVGDYLGLFHMAPNGAVRSSDGDGSVWFTEDLIILGSPKNMMAVFGYEPTSRRLFSSEGPMPPFDKGDLPENHIRFQPENQLLGCDGGLKLAPRRHEHK